MTEDRIDFKAFPSTRYQGSKRKLVNWIYTCIKEVEFKHVVDAFGGSASFSFLAKKMGKSVLYNDLMRFNYLIGKSLIENQGVRVSPEELNYVLTNQNSTLDFNFIQTNFKEIYFTEPENRWLDNTICNIYNLECEKAEVDFKKAILFNALFQSSLAKRPFNLFHRKNLNIRIADVKRNFGNKATWDKAFDQHMRYFVDQINGAVFDNKQNCRSANQSVFEINYEDADCVYLDPPYYKLKGGNETSNYFKCYHFLEGIANYGRWNEMINLETGNRGFKLDNVISHFNKEEIKESFEQLFLNFSKKKIILSYKSDGNPPIEWLENTLKKMGKNVSSNIINYSYALNKQGLKGLPTYEVLLIAK